MQKALEIDSNLAEAHISMASLLMLDEWDWVNAGNEFRLGVKMNPNYTTGHHWYSEWLMYIGNFKEALSEISKAIDLDPVSLGIVKDKGLIFYYSRQYDKAIEIAKTALELDPKFAAIHRLLSLSYLGKEMFDQAIAENKNWADLTGNLFKSKIILAHIYAVSGQNTAARKIVESLGADEILNGKDYRGVALIYVALKENDLAFKMLEKSYGEHETSLCSFKIDPKLDPLRTDPRFNILLEKVGLHKSYSQ